MPPTTTSPDAAPTIELLLRLNNPYALSQTEYRSRYAEHQRSAASPLGSWIDNSLALRGLDRPRIGVVLGTGLDSLASSVERIAELPFETIGLPATTADGHKGKFVLSAHDGTSILLRSGRLHCYENWHPAITALPVRIQALAGIRTFFLTNAAGSLIEESTVGDVVVLTGNRNAERVSPSNGLYDDSAFSGPFGAKFYSVNDVYDPELSAALVTLSQPLDAPFHRGVYQYMHGPRYEEPHEIREMLRQRRDALASGGPDGAIAVVGMSTAPEAYALAQLRTHPEFSDVRVAALSNVTNKAAGIGGSVPTSEEVIQAGPIGGAKIATVLKALIGELKPAQT
jgi:purine-nucleoside phosphorylase